MAEINLEIEEDVFLESYRHLIDSNADINFLWGGRDSGKSYFIAQKLIIDCLSLPYFRCILIRKTYESIKDSQYQLLRDITDSWGISHLFSFKTSPLEIVCANGNKFIARGCDKPEKLKSISNPSDVWYEEGNQLNETDYITVSTTLRSDKGKVREWFSFNPECDEDFNDFWLYKIFFKDHCQNGELSFNGKHLIELPDKSQYELNYTSTHTTYKDNPFCTPERIVRHEGLKNTSQYYYNVFTLGLWGKRIAGGEFYKCYSQSKHLVDIKSIKGFEGGHIPYNPKLALHMAWDFNVNPYVTCNIWQGDGKKVYKIAEILLQHPRNTNNAVCEEFMRLFPSHKNGLYIYGDPGGLKQSTADDTTVRVHEKDYSEFSKIAQYLSKYRPDMRVPRAYPSVKLRGMFINSMLEGQFDGCSILFDIHCTKSNQEYTNLKEASDGTKHKEMHTDSATGVRCQKWGHISDADDYFLTQYFADEFSKYQHGSSIPTLRIGKNTSSNKW